MAGRAAPQTGSRRDGPSSATGRRTAWRSGAGPRTPAWATTDWAYLRLHEGRARPAPGDGRAALLGWVERLAGLGGQVDEVHVFFNDDTWAMALRDAVAFARLARRAGLQVSRTPDPRSIEAR